MRLVLAFSLLATVVVISLVPVSAVLGQDVEGAQDHSLITRYEGSRIAAYQSFEFEELEVPTGPADDDFDYPSESVGGEVTRIMYVAPAGRSVTEVFRNYRVALEAAGFEAIFECSGDDCGSDLGFALYGDDDGPDELVLPPQNAEDIRFLSARASHEGRPVHVTVFAGGGWFDGPMTRVDIVETEAMDADMVSADPVQMFDSIETAGKAVVHDILFATGSTAIEPSSAPALSAIATLLSDHPELTLHVVGHTDATGSLEANMELSRGRAQAVVDALVADHGIRREGLVARGVGPLVPVATNRTEAGRAQNRRVELVDLTAQ